MACRRRSANAPSRLPAWPTHWLIAIYHDEHGGAPIGNEGSRLSVLGPGRIWLFDGEALISRSDAPLESVRSDKNDYDTWPIWSARL